MTLQHYVILLFECGFTPSRACEDVSLAQSEVRLQAELAWSSLAVTLGPRNAQFLQLTTFAQITRNDQKQGFAPSRFTRHALRNLNTTYLILASPLSGAAYPDHARVRLKGP